MFAIKFIYQLDLIDQIDLSEFEGKSPRGQVAGEGMVDG